MARRKSDPWALCAVTAAALLWSSSYAVTKEVLHEVGPLSIGAIRFTLAALLLAVLVRTVPNRPPTPSRPQRRMLYLSGFLGITVYFILENIGVDLSTASDASLIVATYPLMTMLMELVVFRTRMAVLRVTGVLLATVGAFLIVHNGADVGGTARWVGDILLLLGGLAWAGYNVIVKRASTGQTAIGVTYHQTVAGAAGFVVASTLEAGAWRMPSVATSSLLVYLAVACSIGGFLLYNYGLHRMPSTVAVNILNLVPVFGVIGAVVINGETIRPHQLLGGLVIIVGVALGVIERDKPVAANPPAPAPTAKTPGELPPDRAAVLTESQNSEGR